MWLHGCFVRCQPHSLKAKHHSDRNHTPRLIWLRLQREQFVFTLHQWAHQQLHAPLSVGVCVSVYGFVCICVFTVYGICVCGHKRCALVCLSVKIHTEQLEGSFNFITYWDMPVTRLWSAYLVCPSAVGPFITPACHTVVCDSNSTPSCRLLISFTRPTRSYFSLYRLCCPQMWILLEWKQASPLK